MMYTVRRLSKSEIAVAHEDAPCAVVMRDEGHGYFPSHALYPDGGTKDLPKCFALRQEGYEALSDFIEGESRPKVTTDYLSVEDYLL